MKIAVVGCGFVTDKYFQTKHLHPGLEFAAAYDRDTDRLARFCDKYGSRPCKSLDEILKDTSVQMVLNLTNPRSHYEITKACLEAGKHVYSEKPLAMDVNDARSLVELAAAKGVRLSSAPCTLLTRSAQTLWKAVRDNQVGPPRLAMVEMDDGLLHRMPYEKWVNNIGVPWPYRDEFEIGCTLEHAGYCLTWLAAMFGPATSVTAFSSIRIPDKGTNPPIENSAPDFSVACVRYKSGMVARLTCSIVAPRDHRFRVIGDDGVVWVEDVWKPHAPVYTRRYMNIRRKMILSPFKRRYKLADAPKGKNERFGSPIRDYLAGPAELADAIHENRPSRLSAEFSLHITELALAITNAGENAGTYQMTSTFDSVEPLPFAK